MTECSGVVAGRRCSVTNRCRARRCSGALTNRSGIVGRRSRIGAFGNRLITRCRGIRALGNRLITRCDRAIANRNRCGSYRIRIRTNRNGLSSLRCCTCTLGNRISLLGISQRAKVLDTGLEVDRLPGQG